MKALAVSALASLVLLLPVHGHTVGVGDSIVRSQLVGIQPELITPSMKHVDTLETALHTLKPLGTYLNLYSPGNCTALVASMLPVPQTWGNANSWDDSARAMGLTVTTVPKVGAIAESDTDYYLGHVGLVTGVSGDTITIEEENYYGLGVVDTRVANPGEFVYIYF